MLTRVEAIERVLVKDTHLFYKYGTIQVSRVQAMEYLNEVKIKYSHASDLKCAAIVLGTGDRTGEMAAIEEYGNGYVGILLSTVKAGSEMGKVKFAKVQEVMVAPIEKDRQEVSEDSDDYETLKAWRYMHERGMEMNVPPHKLMFILLCAIFLDTWVLILHIPLFMFYGIETANTKVAKAMQWCMTKIVNGIDRLDKKLQRMKV